MNRVSPFFFTLYLFNKFISDSWRSLIPGKLNKEQKKVQFWFQVKIPTFTLTLHNMFFNYHVSIIIKQHYTKTCAPNIFIISCYCVTWVISTYVFFVMNCSIEKEKGYWIEDVVIEFEANRIYHQEVMILEKRWWPLLRSVIPPAADVLNLHQTNNNIKHSLVIYNNYFSFCH